MTRQTRAAERAADESSVDLVARVYHTENGNVHAEGETYTITDRKLAETLRGIGFVSIDGWTEGPPLEAPALESLAPDSVAIGAPDSRCRSRAPVSRPTASSYSTASTNRRPWCQRPK